jgi:hypothetical protein
MGHFTYSGKETKKIPKLFKETQIGLHLEQETHARVLDHF